MKALYVPYCHHSLSAAADIGALQHRLRMLKGVSCEYMYSVHMDRHVVHISAEKIYSILEGLRVFIDLWIVECDELTLDDDEFHEAMEELAKHDRVEAFRGVVVGSACFHGIPIKRR